MMTKKNETELREKETKKENGMKNAKTNKLQKIRFFWTKQDKNLVRRADMIKSSHLKRKIKCLFITNKIKRQY